MATTLAAVRRTKKFKTLIAVGMDETKALKYLGHPVATEPDTKLAELVAAGFTEAEAQQALGLASEASTAVVTPPTIEAPKVLTSKDQGDQLVEAQGLEFAKGRVYVTPDTIEAAVRVRKTGKPEIIASSGAGRTAAVLLFKTDNGDVALQNLIKALTG